MAQMKEQNKTPEKELSKMKTNNQPDEEFKSLVLRMLNKLRERIDDLVRTSTKR